MPVCNEVDGSNLAISPQYRARESGIAVRRVDGAGNPVVIGVIGHAKPRKRIQRPILGSNGRVNECFMVRMVVEWCVALDIGLVDVEGCSGGNIEVRAMSLSLRTRTALVLPTRLDAVTSAYDHSEKQSKERQRQHPRVCAVRTEARRKCVHNN